MRRFLLLAIGTVIGVVIGAWYGWYGNPSTYFATSPDQLKAEYRADYVLMVAEIYASDHDLGAAAVRLSRLGRDDLAELVREIAGAYAAAGYPEEDQTKLNDLARDLARYSTLPTAAAP
jgi:hypothetical protein